MPSPLEQHLWSISLQVSAQESTKHHFQFNFTSALEFEVYEVCDVQISKGNCSEILFIFTLL